MSISVYVSPLLVQTDIRTVSLFPARGERRRRPPESNLRAASGDEDRLGALPDALLLDVLSFLPADQAVRTCVLARRWRNLWRSTPGLRLTYSFDGSWFGCVEDFNKFVNYVILFRDRSPLVKCEICPYPPGDIVDDDPYPYVNMWIQYALMCQVQELQVNANDHYERVPVNVHPVFRHLRTLHLSSVDFPMDLSNFPVLEHLKMNDCIIHMDRLSSRSLQRLCMTGCSFNPDVRTLISTPSLTSLQLDDFEGRTPLLESMPLLETAFVRLNEDCVDLCYNIDPRDCRTESCDCRYDCPVGGYKSVLLNGLSNAVNLELLAAHGVYIYRGDLACCPTFGRLKTLLLNEWCAAIDLQALACILQHSPMLEMLTLQLRKNKHLVSAVGAEGSYYPIAQSFACPHLKVVNIERYRVDDERVCKILKILSTCGTLPEEISIKNTTWLDSFCFSFEKDPQLLLPSTAAPEGTPSTTDGN